MDAVRFLSAKVPSGFCERDEHALKRKMIADPDEILIQNLEYLGGTSFADYWLNTSLSCLEKNWWAALVFACDHIFFQGRGNPLSQRYRNHAIVVLRNRLDLSSGDDISESCPDEAYKRLPTILQNLPEEQALKDYLKSLKISPIPCQCAPLRKLDSSLSLLAELCPHLGTHGANAKALHDDFELAHGANNSNALAVSELDRLPLNKASDVLMLIAFLRFVAKSEEYANVFELLAKQVRDGKFKAANTSLGGLYGLGPKIKPFLIRDVYLFLRWRGELKKIPDVGDDEWASVFPVDTWVRQIAKKLGCPETGTDTDIRTHFLKLCRDGSTGEVRHDPGKVAAGLFDAGSESLNILTDQILPQVHLSTIIWKSQSG